MRSEFSRLQVRGYRRLQDLDLPLAPLNVLIGANGAGKTSVLEVMSLLAASAGGHLQETVSEGGGILSLLTHDRTEPLCLSLDMPVGGPAPIEYELCLRTTGVGYEIASERLSRSTAAPAPDYGPLTDLMRLVGDGTKYIDAKGSDIRYYDVDTRALEQPLGGAPPVVPRPQVVRPTWEYEPLETSLSQVPKMFQEPERFRHVLASSALYHALDVSPRAPVRLPQAMGPAQLPGKDGEDLVSCLYFLREANRDRFEDVEDTLHAAFPTFERMDFPPVAAGTLSMTWRDKQYSKPFYPHQLSEGTLRFLWLVTLLQSPGLPAVTLIDEPEVSLHLEMLRLLAELMREAAEDRTQLIVATHSDRFVRFLQPDELVVCDLDEAGSMVATRGSELHLDAWLRDYSLDELWSMGRLGARPQV